MTKYYSLGVPGEVYAEAHAMAVEVQTLRQEVMDRERAAGVKTPQKPAKKNLSLMLGLLLAAARRGDALKHIVQDYMDGKLEPVRGKFHYEPHQGRMSDKHMEMAMSFWNTLWQNQFGMPSMRQLKTLRTFMLSPHGFARTEDEVVAAILIYFKDARNLPALPQEYRNRVTPKLDEYIAQFTREEVA